MIEVYEWSKAILPFFMTLLLLPINWLDTVTGSLWKKTVMFVVTATFSITTLVFSGLIFTCGVKDTNAKAITEFAFIIIINFSAISWTVIKLWR